MAVYYWVLLDLIIDFNYERSFVLSVLNTKRVSRSGGFVRINLYKDELLLAYGGFF